MRAIWKGHLRFHLVTIPIGLYKAEETANEIHFNQLHKDDYGRIGYVKTCKKCGQEVSNGEIVKGYEVEDDRYVVVDQEEIDAVKVKGTKIIEIEGFVPVEDVHPTLYDDPYYAGPDGLVAAKSYALFRDALAKTGKMGIGRVVLHNRERFVAISPNGPGIVMYRLRLPQEVRKMEDVPEIATTKQDVKKAELDLAVQLIDTMAISFSSLEFRDTYQEALHQLIEAKAEGREFVTAEEAAPEVMDIMSALQQSINQARSSREPMKKAGTKRTPSKKTRAA